MAVSDCCSVIADCSLVIAGSFTFLQVPRIPAPLSDSVEAVDNLPQRATTGHNRPHLPQPGHSRLQTQPATTGHNQPHLVTTGYNLATTGRNLATTGHNWPQPATPATTWPPPGHNPATTGHNLATTWPPPATTSHNWPQPAWSAHPWWARAWNGHLRAPWEADR